MKPNAGARKVSNHDVPGDAEAECEIRNIEAQWVGVSGNHNTGSQASLNNGTIDEYGLDQVTIETQTKLRMNDGLAN